ncbi:hypothetical protein [Haloarchaeobius sp. TZWSO28]|uniref:hypothetical protein n=1 Tax=Haloarchaeobius sp. TZWSO28 TaxID=3446119 RepID=UPI003EBD21E8
MPRATPSRRSVSRALVLLLVVSLSTGCLGFTASDPSPSTDGQDVTVAVTGNSTQSVAANVYLLSEPAGDLGVTYVNGSAEIRSIPEDGASVTYGPESGASAVTVPDRDHQVDRLVFAGQPEWSVQAVNVEPARTAVFAVRIGDQDRLATWGVVTCPGRLERLEVTVNGSSAATTGISCAG